jgi:hypothetical protein
MIVKVVALARHVDEQPLHNEDSRSNFAEPTLRDEQSTQVQIIKWNP